MMMNSEISTPRLHGAAVTPPRVPRYAETGVLALAALFGLLACSFAGAAFSIDLSFVGTAICGIAKQLASPAIVGAAGFMIIVIFGWNKMMGEGNAFSGLKTGFIGGAIILAASELVSLIFAGATGCA